MRAGVGRFDPDRLEAMRAQCREPECVEDGGALQIWKQPQKSGGWRDLPLAYIIGADTSEGGEHSSYCTAIVIEQGTGEVVASLHGRWHDHVYAEKLAELGHRYNEAVVAVERNNTGLSVLNTLINGGMEEWKVGRTEEWKVGGMEGWKDDIITLHSSNLPPFHSSILPYPSIYHDQDDKPGWCTDGQSRPVLLAMLDRAIEEGWWNAPDEELLGELQTVIHYPDRKPRAAPGRYDDRVIAAGIALCAREEGWGWGDFDVEVF